MRLIKIIYIADYYGEETMIIMIMTIVKNKGDDNANVVDNKLN